MSNSVVLTSQAAALKQSLLNLEQTRGLTSAQYAAVYISGQHLRKCIKKLLGAGLVDAGHLGVQPDKLV